MEQKNDNGFKEDLMFTVNLVTPIALRIIVLAALLFSLSACTVTETINDILSSTTPGDWYTGDGLVKDEFKPHVFVAVNLDNLKSDLAKGQGEYWTSLIALLKVAPEHQSEFFSLIQREYSQLAQEDQHIRVTRTLINLSKQFRREPGV